ncbi:hypothetical protein KP78_23630 [Jeotgalibacillus soli]|uniref:Uncharacterized protein n=1 Tax=Jeotgalibacillus soli TaxID=889306 RepID=A0A0C2RST1_9BACL|nr:hypothetical protein KP78_23630 [Jeotgalibacillus soli]
MFSSFCPGKFLVLTWFITQFAFESLTGLHLKVDYAAP